MTQKPYNFEDNIICEKILNVLSIMYPNKYLLNNLNNYDDLIKFTKVIKYSSYSEELLNKVLDIVCEKQKEGQRFKKNDCFTLINSIRKKNSSILENKIICRNIFFLFKENILLIKNEVIANRLSVTLKNCLLEDNEIKWLINHYDKSNYILNRLLRYPVKSPMISEWLIKNINIVPSRKGEIIGWIIDYDSEYQDKDLKSFIWGVFYSRISVELKKQILISIMNNNNLDNVIDNVIEVCKRLNFLEILEQRLHYSRQANLQAF